jgi:hypothetical protein
MITPARARRTGHRSGRRLRRLLAAALLSIGLAPAVAACGGSAPMASWRADPVASQSASASSIPSNTVPMGNPRAPQPAPGKVIVGGYVDLPGKTEAQSIALRTQQLGRNYRIIHDFYAYRDNLPRVAPAGMAPGAILMVSWRGPLYQEINSGADDTFIGQQADRLVAYGKPVFLRFGWEMNGDWYQWDGTHNGNNPGGFITAWRRIHAIFARHGATNVGWVWGPNWDSVPNQPWNDMDKYYPGDDYVDWIGISGYFGRSQSPQLLYDSFYARYAPHKPLMIAETGALERGGRVKADWIEALHQWVAQHPAVKATVWFDTVTGPDDWRIDSTSTALDAFRRMINDPYFGG